MTSTPAQLIKEKLDIAEVLKGYLTLQPAGRNFKALCPFHKEKTPSFMISPDRQSWHCFGCANGGDVFEFVMKYENVEFGEALRLLADKAGVELRRVNPAEHKYTGLLLELNEAAKEFFRTQLAAFEPARKYLAERNLKKETIDLFELGWAPAVPDALTGHFLNRNFRPEDLVQAGLVLRSDRGSYFDRFRGRIMFPIHNHVGKVVGFTGRILPQFDNGETAKYMNSPETPVFNKSKLLYGFWQSKNSIREKNAAFLVEGQMDFLMSYQAGATNAIATSGTALTGDHLRTLRRLTDRLVLSFDNDTAGMEAGERAIDLADAADFQVRVADLGSYKDPGDMGSADPAGLVAAVEAARPSTEFYFRKYLEGVKVDPADRGFLKRLRAVLAKLRQLASPVERDHWLRELSKRTSLAEKALREEMDRIEAAPAVQIPAGEASPAVQVPERSFSRWESLSQRILSALYALQNFQLLGPHAEYLAFGYKDVLSLLERGAKSAPDAATDGLLNLILLRSEELSPEEIQNLKEQLFREYLKERRRELTDAIRAAEARGDEAAMEAALAEFNRLPAL